MVIYSKRLKRLKMEVLSSTSLFGPKVIIDDDGGTIPMDISEEEEEFIPPSPQSSSQINNSDGSGLGLDPADFICADDEEWDNISNPITINGRKIVHAKRNGSVNRVNNSNGFRNSENQLFSSESLLHTWVNPKNEHN